jgi:hypothetical protein
MKMIGYSDRTLKRCKWCKQVKPTSEFSRHPQTADRLCGHCKDCERLRARRWRQNNPDKVREKKRRHYGRNKEKVLARNRQYRSRHKEAIRKKERQRKTTNREQIRNYHKHWRKRNRESVKEGQRRYWSANRERLNEKNRLRYHRDRKSERERSRRYAALYPEKARTRRKRWLKNNPEKRRERARQRYRRHSPAILERNRDWARRNRGKLRQIKADYKKRNPEKVRKIQREWHKKQRSINNVFYLLNKRMSGAINRSLRNGKNGRRTEDVLGYTMKDLWAHLLTTIPPETTIEQFHLPYGDPRRFEIHHIVGIAEFRYETPEDPAFKACWAKSNLQLVPAKDHPRGKQNKIPGCVPRRLLITRRK